MKTRFIPTLCFSLVFLVFTNCSPPKPQRPQGPPPSQSGTTIDLTDPKQKAALKEIAREMGREMGREMAQELKREWGDAPLAIASAKTSQNSSTQTSTSATSSSSPTVTLDHCTEVVREHYESNPEFYTIATPDDIPNDLEWLDGSDLKPFASPNAVQGGTFQEYTGDFPRTLRFVGPDANGSFRRHIHDSNTMLLTNPYPNGDGDYPGLAKSWAIGKDGKTVYFKLDPDARYSDRKPVRATDYFFHQYFMRSPHITAPWYSDFYSKDKFPNITIYDEHTISITYWKAKPDIIEKVSGVRPIPEHFYEELDEFYLKDYDWKMEPTTGPYQVLTENIVKGSSITLTRVPNWWANDKTFYKNRFNPEKIKVTVVRDPTKVFELFKKGELDIFGLALPEFYYDKLPDDAEQVANGYIHKITFYNEIPRPTWGLRINTAQPLLNNRDIRTGINYAMNWDLVIEKVFRGDYARMNTVADGYGPRSHPTLRARGFDVEKALEYFAKAGFTKRGPDGILVNEQGQKLSFTLTTGYKRVEDVLTVLKQEAPKAGLELNLEILELTAAWKKIDEKNHQIAFGALNVSVEMYPRFWETYHSDNAYEEKGDDKYNSDGTLKDNLTPKVQTNNSTNTAVKEIDQMIVKYRRSESLDEITELSHKLLKALHEEAAFIPGWYKPWYRIGHWRWVKFPETFDVKESREPVEFHLHWIDVKAKEETQKALDTGKAFEKVIKVHDPYGLRPE